jgi:hypothetical protein
MAPVSQWSRKSGSLNASTQWASMPVIGIAFTHEVLLHPVKVGVWYGVSARRIVAPVFFNETIAKGIYVYMDSIFNTCDL